MKNKTYKVREIQNDIPFVHTYIDLLRVNKNPHHQFRLAPARTYSNDNLIYANKLAIFSIEKDLFVTVIESEAIANSYRNHFELAWQSAKEVKK